ncbi:50S ribosomal protein L18e [Halolamina litorea]|uniref:Large ribosomal subunit protein eL18 n=1 Tax=Halolamina litorea TaxID=1515593 RepID=A0ABD6BTG8_9EURY
MLPALSAFRRQLHSRGQSMSSNKTNPRLGSLIAELKSVSRDVGANVWSDVAERLEKPRRTHAEVNLGRIERYAQEDETVIVPGKVLGSGVLQKDVTVAAVSFSGTARKKIDQVGEAVQLEQILEDNPEGSNVRVIR